MRHAAGQLADQLHLLRLAQLLLGALALRHLPQRLAMRGLQFARALGHAFLQRLVQAPQLGDAGARLELPLPAGQGGPHHADEGGGMEGPLQEGDVAQQFDQAAGLRVAFRRARPLGQHDEGKV